MRAAVESTEHCRTDIVWMERRDRAAVLDIEAMSFEFPWRGADFAQTLIRRNCIGMVARRREETLGFMVYELHKQHIHILKFAVHPAFRRRGVGRVMVDKLCGKIEAGYREKLVLEVCETNLPAQLFFKDMGFQAIDVLHDFYGEHTDADAYVMQRCCTPK